MKKTFNLLLIVFTLVMSCQIASASTTAGNLLTDIFNDRSIIDEMGGWYTDDLKITGTTTQQLGTGEYYVSWTLERVSRTNGDDAFRFEYTFDGQSPHVVSFSGLPQEGDESVWLRGESVRGSDRMSSRSVAGGTVQANNRVAKRMVPQVPVPGAFLLFGSGLVALAGFRRGRQ